MFEGWDSFYLLIGGAAGAMIGLLFVVATLNSGQNATQVVRGASLYMTPTVFHFAMVLSVGAIAVAPGLRSSLAGLIILGCGLVGLAHMATVCVRMRKPGAEAPPHWSDFWCYGAAPTFLYLALVVAALAVLQGWAAAPRGVAAVLLVLLLLSVRNAWDLVTWLAPRASKD